MAHVRIALLIITLFHLCRAQRSGTGTWYAANVINDGEFSPKPLTEIFSTPSTPPFSTKNPIVVLPPSSPTQGVSTSSISTTFGPNGFNTYSTSGITPEQFSSTTPSTLANNYISSTLTSLSDQFFSTTPSPLPSRFSLDTQSTLSSFPTQPGTPESRLLPFQLERGFPLLQETGKQQGQVPPNYFVIYQQAPQTVQNLPTGPQQTQSNSGQPESSSQISSLRPEISTFSSSTFSTLRPEISTPQTTFSTFQPPTSQTTVGNIASLRTTLSTIPTTRFSPNLPSNPTTQRSTVFPGTQRTTRPILCNNTSGLPLGPNYPSLRIRMIAPKGTVTNILLNPQPVATTTQRPKTTRRPTTPRTRRTKRTKNSFDGCVNMCSGKKAPICAAPLAKIPIDPNTLKGFPSVCHMACHNSFKKDQYEMLIDGRCGRLRNRIRPLDSDTKLKRTELNKVQYTIVNDPQTIVEVSNLPR